MFALPYEVVRDFEKTIASFVGCKHAVAVDSCTNALFLCCKWHKVETVTIPRRTYVSVPMSIIHAGGKVKFEHRPWKGSYRLEPYPIYDSACQLTPVMWGEGAFMCISFSANKPINIGKGGMILHDDDAADDWFRRARYMGRGPVPVEEDRIEMLGWNMYMTPEQAARGLLLASHLDSTGYVLNRDFSHYPDLREQPIF